MNFKVKYVCTLLQTASFLALANVAAAQSQQTAQNQMANEAPEQVLVTGSLIHGAAAVGVPVTTLSDQDFKETGSLTIADVLKVVPSLYVNTSNVGTPGQTFHVTKAQEVEIRGVPKETLLMIDGIRFPFQNFSTCYVDPSIIPQLAAERIDVLADGASATYGSDAVAGVINVILKRGFDGAISQVRYARSPDIGDVSYQATQLYGRKWDTGDVTVSYEWYHENKVHGDVRPYLTFNYERYGFDNQTPIGAANPGVVSTGALSTNPALAAVGLTAALGSRACANCFSIPSGTGWNYGTQAPGPTTTWTTLLANPGVTTLRNPYDVVDILPTQDRSAATITFDQNLIKGVSFFGDGFYSNRRAVQFSTPGQTPAQQQTLSAVQVPTFNPYYPTGAPAGLRVSYELGYESDTRVSAGEHAERYDFGFNLDLPFDWHGRVYHAISEDKIFDYNTGQVNLNMVSAALGNTVAALPANGVTPPMASFTKPANIPYLNLFCDATAFTCNSPATIAYIQGYQLQNQRFQIGENGINLDGPVIEIPGGMLRAAAGATWFSEHYDRTQNANFNTFNTSVPLITDDGEVRNFWAAFGQINVPVVGERNHIPLVKGFDIEASLRYDSYDVFGGVTTPKVAATWNMAYGLSLRGTWGKSFRAPVFSESTATGGLMIQPTNVPAGAVSNTLNLNCPSVPGQPNSPGAANPGSLNAYLNPTCSNSVATLSPGGIRLAAGAAGAAIIRPANETLGPENAKNWALGFNFAPTDFLAGLNIDATWYNIRIDNLIGNNTGGVNANDPTAKICTQPTAGCIYIVRPSPNLPITDPSNASFLALVNSLVLSPVSTVPSSAASAIQFINDSAITNLGWRALSGIDFNARYDIDAGDLGAFTAGIDGTYKFFDKIEAVLGGPISNNFELVGTNAPIGHDIGGLLKYRARLGWTGTQGASNGVSITGFANFTPHSANWAGIAPTFIPPACFWAVGFHAGSCYPGSPYWGPYSSFPNSVPAQVTFDVTLGYDTGDRPANFYLRNMNFQFTVLNLLNRQPPFVYATAGSRTFPGVQSIPPDQRYISFAITKAW
jgi:outer membrane receptor protein involved in Fe transport